MKTTYRIAIVISFLLLGCQSVMEEPDAVIQPPGTISNSTGFFDIGFNRIIGGSQLEYGGKVITTEQNIWLVATTESKGDKFVPASKGYTDVMVTKLTLNGDLIWTKTYGGAGWENAFGIMSSQNGNILIGANINEWNNQATGDLPAYSGKGKSAVWIFEIASDGAIVKSKIFGGECFMSHDNWIRYSENEIIIAGQSQTSGCTESNSDFQDLTVTKINNQLEIVWARNFGGSLNDFALDMTLSTDKNILLLGYTESNDGDASGSRAVKNKPDIWVLKVSSMGVKLWSKTFGGSRSDVGHAIAEMPDGTIVIGGETVSDDGDVIGYHNSTDNGATNVFPDALALKLNSAGEKIWIKAWGGKYGEGFTNIIQNADNSVLFVGGAGGADGDVKSEPKGPVGVFGFHLSDLWFFKLNTKNELEWEQRLGGAEGESATNVVVLPNTNEFILCANTMSKDGDVPENRGYNDIWLLKIGFK